MTNSKMVTQLERFLTVALGSGTMDANYSIKKSTKMKKLNITRAITTSQS